MKFVWGLIGLGFLVLIHELGHFFAAKIFGVKVEAFSIGMGPVLLHKKIHDTDWRLSLIPFGGYCAMKGEKDYAAALELGYSEIKGEADSFYGIHAFKRLLIALAGPFTNLTFGFIAFTIVALIGYTYYSKGTVVSMADEVFENVSSPAHEAGMQTGDKILYINDEAVEDFSDIASYVSIHPDEDLIFTVERVSGAPENASAVQASASGAPENASGSLHTSSERTELKITVHSFLDKETGRGMIGIAANSESVIKREKKGMNFFPAIKEGALQTAKLIDLTFKGIAALFKGVNVMNAVSGPAKISGMLGESMIAGFNENFHTGLSVTLQFLALISISLFLTNLLPVPVLDGGLIIFSLIEILTRKKLHPKLLYYLQFAGIAFVSLLAVLAISGDILYFIKQGHL